MMNKRLFLLHRKPLKQIQRLAFYICHLSVPFRPGTTALYLRVDSFHIITCFDT